jgi:hypothetical protein
MKDIEAIMDRQGTQVLNALRNLNDDSQYCFVGISVIDAYSSSVPTNAGNWWMPCQLRQIAKGYWDTGDTSRFGRVGEVLAVISFIVFNEWTLWQPLPPAWYWYWRHLYSPTPSGITYLQLNPDFKIQWTLNVHEVWQHDWFGIYRYYREGFTNGYLDAMEVKSTRTTDWRVQVCKAERQLMSLGLSVYDTFLATGVKMTDTANQDVYFEIASNYQQFRYLAYC